jgi:hypothetical protein
LLAVLSFLVKHVGTNEKADNKRKDQCVNNDNDGVVKEHLHKAFAAFFDFIFILTIRAIEALWAGAFTVAADAAIQALTEAFRDFCINGLEVCTPVLVTIICQPN